MGQTAECNLVSNLQATDSRQFVTSKPHDSGCLFWRKDKRMIFAYPAGCSVGDSVNPAMLQLIITS
jgi:hypothetical protein